MKMRRAGQLNMTTEVLKNCLQIPEDTKIMDVHMDHAKNIIRVVLEDGEWLPEAMEGIEAMCVVVPTN